jgi:hypothetical protein
MTGGGIDIDINNPLYALIYKIKSLDATFDATAFLRRLEETSDGMNDNMPLKVLKGPLLSLSVPEPIARRIAEVPLPFRLLIAMGHSLLDILRLLVSLPGADMPILRQVFSVALASLEFFRGQWKQSLLSAAGIMSQSAMYAGFVGKVLVNIFSLISPSIQEDIILGTYSVTKSLIIGILIKLFQITATYDTRKAAMDVFRELAEKNKMIDTALEEGGLVGQPSNRSPDMSDPNRLQAALQDRTMTCSKEFQGVIKIAKQDIILKLIFQMLNMPVSEEDLLHHCERFQKYMKDNQYLSYKELLVKEAQINKEMYEEVDSQNKPTSAPAPAPESTTPAPTPTPTPPAPKTVPAPTTAPITPESTPESKPTAPPKKGGSRRTPRTLKKSSLPSRKKRKSQPLSR